MNKKQIQIVADENISGLENFAKLANVSKVPGRSLSAESIKNADALLVRSVSKINKSLLKQSSVKFIASATSGIDHVDINYLQENNIEFAYAPGSNANSVVQYVFATLAFLSEQYAFDWRKLSVAIIGAGNVGALLAAYLEKLNIDFVIYDPYLDDSHPYSDRFVSFNKALEQDLVTIHTPLSFDGLYPTRHLFDATVIQALREDSILINTSRGAVLDNQILHQQYKHKPWRCVLDVWENEPEIFMPLLKQVDIATCHIAGYSYEGKEQGTAQIYQAFVDFFNLNVDTAYPLNTDSEFLELPASKSDLTHINQTILAAYSIQHDHLQMQKLGDKESTVSFDDLRKNYSLRREFPYYRLNYSNYTEAAEKVLRGLGFN